MDDQMLDLMDPGDHIVGRLLQVYGEEALSPRVASSTRMRMVVMGAAHRRAALIAADARTGAGGPSIPFTPVRAADHRPAFVAWRRPVAAVMAGCLTLGILAGTAFAASPGGLLYEARIWTEMATLPGAGVERAEAEVHRLAQRLQEVQDASRAGDSAAIGAALAAYSSILAEATRGADGDPAATSLIEVALSQHVVVLTQLIEGAPAPAVAALEGALTSSSKALDTLAGGLGPDGGAPGAGGGTTGGPTNTNATSGDHQNAAGASPAAGERPSSAPAGGDRPKPDKPAHDDLKPSRDRDGQRPNPNPTDGSHGPSSESDSDEP